MNINDPVLAGKVAYVKRASLDIVFSFGNIVNHVTWIPADQDFPRDLQIEIYLDNQLLLSQLSDDKVHEFHYDFEDSTDLLQRELRIGCSGFLPKHFPVFEIVPMLYIQKVCVEGLNMHQHIRDHAQGVYVDDAFRDQVAYPRIGHNGYMSWKFETPIYPWLLKNEQDNSYYRH